MSSPSPQHQNMDNEKEECMVLCPQTAFRQRMQEHIANETFGLDSLLDNALFKVKESTSDGKIIVKFILVQNVESLGKAAAKESTYSSYKIKLPYNIKMYVYLFLRIDNTLPVQDTGPTMADACVGVCKTPSKRSYDDCATCMTKPFDYECEKTFTDLDIRKRDGTAVSALPDIYAGGENDAESLVNPVPYSSIGSNANEIGPSSVDSDNPQDSPANNGLPQGQQASNGSGGDVNRGNDRGGSGADGRGGGNGSGDGRPPPWYRTTGSPGDESDKQSTDDEEEELNHNPCNAKTDPEKRTDTSSTEETRDKLVNEISDSTQSSTTFKYETVTPVSDDSCQVWRRILLAMNWQNYEHMLALTWAETQTMSEVEPRDDPPPSSNSPLSVSDTEVPEILFSFIIMLQYCSLRALLELRILYRLLWTYFLTVRMRLQNYTHRPQFILRRHQQALQGGCGILLMKKIQKWRKGLRRLRQHIGSARSRRRRWADPGRNPSSPSVDSERQEATGIQCFDEILSSRGTFIPNPRPGNLGEPNSTGTQGNDDGMENRTVIRPPCLRLRRNITLWAECEEDLEELSDNEILHDDEDNVEDFSQNSEIRLRHGLVLIEDDETNWQNEAGFDDESEARVFSLERRPQLQQRSGYQILGADGGVQDTETTPTVQQDFENRHDHSVDQETGENAEGAVGGEADSGGGPDVDRCVRCKVSVPKERVHQCGRAYCFDCIRQLSAPPSVLPQSGCPDCG